MSAEQGFALHPLAAPDITDIWEYIAEDSLSRPAVFGRKYSTEFAPRWRFRIRVIDAQSLLRARCGSSWCVSM
jgi:hypothetical protein